MKRNQRKRILGAVSRALSAVLQAIAALVTLRCLDSHSYGRPSAQRLSMRLSLFGAADANAFSTMDGFATIIIQCCCQDDRISLKSPAYNGLPTTPSSSSRSNGSYSLLSDSCSEVL